MHIRNIAYDGPLYTWTEYTMYFVNGYRFQTEARSSGKATYNSGVSIIVGDTEYFGRVINIYEVGYPKAPTKRCVVFRCEWFDPTPDVGTRVHENYNLVDINATRRLETVDPFILTAQEIQVTYVAYPGATGSRADWLAV